MTKKDTLNLFKIIYNIKEYRHDKIMLREIWGEFTDSLCKNGDITTNQYNNWCNPF